MRLELINRIKENEILGKNILTSDGRIMLRASTKLNNTYLKKNYTPHDAYELIMAGSGIMFDIEVVNAFRKTFAVYPLGCCVKLSNEVEGYVISQNINFPDRPVLRVLYDHITKAPISFYEINLLETLDLIIKNIV